MSYILIIKFLFFFFKIAINDYGNVHTRSDIPKAGSEVYFLPRTFIILIILVVNDILNQTHTHS